MLSEKVKLIKVEPIGGLDDNPYSMLTFEVNGETKSMGYLIANYYHCLTMSRIEFLNIVVSSKLLKQLPHPFYDVSTCIWFV